MAPPDRLSGPRWPTGRSGRRHNVPMTSRLRLRLDVDEFDRLFSQVCGGRAHIREAHRLTGGSTKGVYRLLLDDGGTVVAYVWSRDEDYWAAPDAPAASGIIGGHRFAAAHAAMSEAGVRVPRLLGLDLTRTQRDGDIAFLEDVRGGSLEAALDAGRPGSESALIQLADLVRRMHGHRRERFGPPEPPEGLSFGTTGAAEVPRSASLAVQVVQNAEGDLAEAAEREPRLAAVRGEVAETLRARLDAVRPRSGYGLRHGELGPDHVMLDDAGDPVLIDIETATYEDAEREHAFLELRFGPRYRVFDTTGLDPDRLSLYRLTTYLGLVAGPLRLLDGDFPDRAFMLDVVEQNVRRVLGQLG
jgi:hypothetical protein